MDLNTMFQNGMGPYAALQAGRQVVADRQMGDANLRAKQLENEQTAAMNPLNQQFRQGQIAQQGAELPGIQGQSASLASQGQVDTATTSAKVAQRLSSLSNQVGVDGMEKMGREGAMALQASQALAQYPPALHKEVLPKLLAQYGMDPNSPMVAGILKMPDEMVQKSLSTLGSGMALASKDYLQKSALQTDDNKSKERIADTHAAATIYSAKIMAASREAAANARAGAMKHMSVDQAIAMLETTADRSPEEDQQLVALKKQQLQARAAGAQAVAPTMLGQDTPLQAAAKAAGEPPASQAAPPAQSPTPHGKVKQVGTSGGRPVFEDEKGNRFIN